MELMKKLFHGKGYIDGITIINLEGEILFTAKLNNKLSSQEEPYELVGQKFLDVYENLIRRQALPSKLWNWDFRSILRTSF